MGETTNDFKITVSPADSIAAITIYTTYTADNVNDIPPSVYLYVEMRGAHSYLIEQIKRAANIHWRSCGRNN